MVLEGTVTVMRGPGQVRPSKRVIFHPEISMGRPETFWNSILSLAPVSSSVTTIEERVVGPEIAERLIEPEKLVATLPMSSRAVRVTGKDSFRANNGGRGLQSKWSKGPTERVVKCQI